MSHRRLFRPITFGQFNSSEQDEFQIRAAILQDLGLVFSEEALAEICALACFDQLVDQIAGINGGSNG